MTLFLGRTWQSWIVYFVVFEIAISVCGIAPLTWMGFLVALICCFLVREDLTFREHRDPPASTPKDEEPPDAP